MNKNFVGVFLRLVWIKNLFVQDITPNFKNIISIMFINFSVYLLLKGYCVQAFNKFVALSRALEIASTIVGKSIPLPTNYVFTK